MEELTGTYSHFKDLLSEFETLYKRLRKEEKVGAERYVQKHPQDEF